MKIVTPAFVFLLMAGTAWAQQSPAPAAVPAPEEKATTLLQLIMTGGVMMIPLILLSIITVMLCVIFIFTLRRGNMASGRYMQTADALIRKKDFLGLLAISNRHNEAVARIMQRTMDFLSKNPKAGMSEAREVAQTEGVRQASAINQQVSYLADIGALAPMFGLLGTVIGIVQSFGVIAVDAAATRPTLLAHGIGEALIATAAGLVVGIPAMAAYAFFRGRAQAAITELEGATTHLLALLSVNGVKNSGKDLL